MIAIFEGVIKTLLNTDKMFTYWSSLVKLAGPIFLSLVGVQFMEMIDSAMIGRLGVTPLAAAAFVNGVVGIFLVVGTGFTSAVSVMVSRFKGEEDANKKCSEFMCVSLWAGILVTIFLTFILEILRHNLHLFGQTQSVLDASPSYFLLIELSLFPHIMFQVYKQFSDGMGHTLDGSIGVLVSLILNVIFNWIFIFGNLGAPALGIVGAGIGTLSSRVVLWIGYYYYLKRFSRFRNIEFFKFKITNFKQHAKILAVIGLSVSLQYLFEAGIFSASTIMAGWIDEISLASHQIALKISSSCFMLPLSLSFAASIQVGSAVGKRDVRLAKEISDSAFYFTILVMLCIATFLWFSRFILPRGFIDAREVLELTAPVLVITAIFQVFDGTQTIATGILRGYLDTRVPVIITFIAYWLISFPAAYYFSFSLDFGLLGLWYGLMIGLAVSSSLLNLRVRRISSKSF